MWVSDLGSVGKHVTHTGPNANSKRFQAQDSDNKTIAETLVAGTMVQEDSLGVSQSPVLDEACELLHSNDQFDKDVNNEAIDSHNDKTGNAGEIEPKEADTKSPPSVPVGIESVSSISEAAEPEFFDGTASAAEREPGSPCPITMSLVTPPEASNARLEAVPLRTGDVPVGEVSKVDFMAYTEDPVEKPEATTDSPKHIASPTSPISMPENAATPAPSSSKKSHHAHKSLDGSSPGESPQIGTSLLRRESLRRKDSPTQRKETRRTKSPRKIDTLSRRDTLQEREILQKVIAETSQDDSTKEIDNRGENVAGSATVPLSSDTQGDTDASSLPTEISQSSHDRSADADKNLDSSSDANVKKDLHRAIEAIEVLQQPLPDQLSETLSGVPTDQVEEIKAINKTNESIAMAEVEEAAQTIEAVTGHAELPRKTTRSATRFSDETSMLRDFLNRAQASKAAKSPVLLPLDAPDPQISPRRSPRKALGSHKGVAPARQKAGEVFKRPSTPPSRSKCDALEFDDAEEITATPTSCRRSTRGRPPATPKVPPNAPSFIPVRRADGADPVVLQKSEAQELAMVTRANTRRNKGQSKPPLEALKELPAETAALVEARERAEKGKAVGWAETLASYREAAEKAEEGDEVRSRVRRMRVPNAANGTPAAKKSAKKAASVDGTPAPKRRGKVVQGK